MTSLRRSSALALLFVTSLSLLSCATVQSRVAPTDIPDDGVAQRERTDDALEYRVGTRIAAPAEKVWAVLTDADGYTSWNTTLQSLTGDIRLDGKLDLVMKAAPDQTFNITVTSFEAPRSMVWESGMPMGMFRGVRTFTLLPTDDGATIFAMSEVYSGSMLGMIESNLPDMRPSFEAFATSLKDHVENGGS